MEPSIELGPFQDRKRDVAVCVRRAVKQYGLKHNKITVLDGINMTVEKGTIYGLLGASGCGKTTLLTCIVGRRRLNSGNLWVLGGKPGEGDCGIPGPRVGYMPQDIALLDEFTIEETFIYFGWVCGLKNSYIRKRTDELTNFLELPSPKRRVGKLSGGQKRRVSFAVALLHDPELLILDEPTVGVDPVLRQSIWDYLIEITSQHEKTVIITTHYIDEARQAQRIGLMREGILLAEATPKALLERFQSDSLEEVFLRLSVRQQRTQEKTEVATNADFKNSEFHELNESIDEIPEPAADSHSLYEYNAQNYEGANTKPAFRNHLKALLWKNILWIRRNKPIILFLFVLPVVQMIIFCVSIGRDPNHLHLAIVNDELESYQNCESFHAAQQCNMSYLSCQYLDFFRNRTSYVQDVFPNLIEARHAVKVGNAWGILHFNQNYSDALRDRIDLGNHASEDIVADADIGVILDMSNQAVGHLLQRDVTFTFLDFIKHTLSICDWNPKVVDIPMKFNTPIYGSSTPRFLDFASPGSILAMVFILAVALTGGSILAEKAEGIVERCLVAGVSMQEVLLSHIIVETVIMAGQCASCLIVGFAVYDLTNVGPWILVISLSLLQGVNGMCLGFLLSTIFDSLVMATLLGIGYFLMVFFISGIVWPIEGMHWFLQHVVFVSPLTTASESMRSIMLRGWGISEPVVYYGYISTIIWIAIYLSLTLLSLRFKKLVM